MLRAEQTAQWLSEILHKLMRGGAAGCTKLVASPQGSAPGPGPTPAGRRGWRETRKKSPSPSSHLCFKKERGSPCPPSAAAEASQVTPHQPPFMAAVPA